MLRDANRVAVSMEAAMIKWYLSAWWLSSMLIVACCDQEQPTVSVPGASRGLLFVFCVVSAAMAVVS